MNYGADRYCKLFVSGAADDEALSAAVNAALRESAERTAAGADAVPVLDITVHAQVRHLPLDDGQDDFTHWRHYLDIDTAQEDVSTVGRAFMPDKGSEQILSGMNARPTGWPRLRDIAREEALPLLLAVEDAQKPVP